MTKEILDIPAIARKEHWNLIDKLVKLPNKIVNLKKKQEIINKLSRKDVNENAVNRLENLINKSHTVSLKLEKNWKINCKKHIWLCRKR